MDLEWYVQRGYVGGGGMGSGGPCSFSDLPPGWCQYICTVGVKLVRGACALEVSEQDVSQLLHCDPPRRLGAGR